MRNETGKIAGGSLCSTVRATPGTFAQKEKSLQRQGLIQYPFSKDRRSDWAREKLEIRERLTQADTLF